MSWTGTWTYFAVRALDVLVATDTTEVPDITISTLCYIVQQADLKIGSWPQKLASLKLKDWQISLLRWIGPKLDEAQANHRLLASQSDYQKAQRIASLLS